MMRVMASLVWTIALATLVLAVIGWAVEGSSVAFVVLGVIAALMFVVGVVVWREP